jgi:hypothetical protein
MPWLVAELGLGELVPYVTNPYLLCDVGPGWQRIRGTPAAIATGLGWVGYSGRLEWALPRRRRWHLWQMRLDRLPDAERPDLDRIDGIASLSDDATSHYWRGYRDYDVRPMETGGRRWGAAMWGASSGVRVGPGGALWSFGRRHEMSAAASEADLQRIDAWIEPATESGRWSEMTVAWRNATYPWSVSGRAARRRVIIADLASRTLLVRLSRADGTVIGWVRPLAHPVRAAVSGPYAIGSVAWTVDEDLPEALYLQARTPFGVAAGATAARAALVVDPTISGVPIGRAWIGPEHVAGGAVIAEQAIDATMAATIRETIAIVVAVPDSRRSVALADDDGSVIDIDGSALSAADIVVPLALVASPGSAIDLGGYTLAV